MKREDIPDGLSLCRAANWNQVQRDWEIFLQMEPNGNLVAESSGQVVGTAATLRYQQSFSWISMVLVGPAFHRQGIGMGLLTKALELLSGEETVKLDATPAGREIYLKLDFVDEYPLSRLQSVDERHFALPLIRAATVPRPMTQDDFPAIIASDSCIFGADRENLLAWYLEGGPAYAWVMEKENELSGYCFGRNGHNFVQIGPVVAFDKESARQLVVAALNNCLGQQVIIDVLHHDPEWVDWLILSGFTKQRSFIRMYRGANQSPGKPGHQFAIAGPEFG